MINQIWFYWETKQSTNDTKFSFTFYRDQLPVSIDPPAPIVAKVQTVKVNGTSSMPIKSTNNSTAEMIAITTTIKPGENWSHIVQN